MTRAGDKQERQAKYLRALRRHANIGTAAAVAGIRYGTVLRWRRDTEFGYAEQIVRDDLEVQGRLKAANRVPPAWVIRVIREWLGVNNVKIAEIFGVSTSAITHKLKRDTTPVV